MLHDISGIDQLVKKLCYIPGRNCMVLENKHFFNVFQVVKELIQHLQL